MKFFNLTALAFLSCSLVSSQDCGKGKVADFQNICIEPNYIEGCEVYESESTCHQCEVGYHVENGYCSATFENSQTLQNRIIGCLTKNADQQCVNCANGFIEKNGKCSRGIINCSEYDQENNCSKCKKGFTLVLGKCLRNVLLGCKKQANDHTCEECWEPFQKVGSQCDIQNCQSLNDYGCTTCQCGYYLNSQRKCEEVDKGCIRYERGKCINCLPHFQLRGGICEIDGCATYDGHVCSECGENFENNSDGGCTFKNCIDWQRDSCLICKQGFKLVDGKCEQSENFTCI